MQYLPASTLEIIKNISDEENPNRKLDANAKKKTAFRT